MFLLFASFLNAQTLAAERQPKQVPAFMGPCANLVCEVENDWSRNNVMLYGLANSMPEDKFGYKPTPEQHGQQRMKNAVWVDLVNMLLWLVSAIYSTIIFWTSRKNRTLHTGRAKV